MIKTIIIVLVAIALQGCTQGCSYYLKYDPVFDRYAIYKTRAIYATKWLGYKKEWAEKELMEICQREKSILP